MKNKNINRTIIDNAIALQNANKELKLAIETFLKNPIGRNKEKMADLVNVDLQGEPKNNS